MALQGKLLSFGYRDSRTLLNDINLTLNIGEIVGVAGANGVGKSTLLNLLCGYLRPLSGEVWCDGRELSELSVRNSTKYIAVVPQSVNSPMPYSVEEIVRMGLCSRRSRFIPFSHDDAKAVEASLDELDITHLRKRRFNELSGGEQQRVVIAASVVRKPRYLLLDEPTSHLDLGHAVALLNSLKKLSQESEQGTLIISHDIQMMAGFCDRIILMNDGAIVAEGKPRDVVTAENIQNVYGCEVTVMYADDGRPVFIPSLTTGESS